MLGFFERIFRKSEPRFCEEDAYNRQAERPTLRKSGRTVQGVAFASEAPGGGPAAFPAHIGFVIATRTFGSIGDPP
jgi:hypothetical protein